MIKNYIKLPKKIKQDWINALKSGNYIQGSGQLCNFLEGDELDEIEYCCLGVLGSLLGCSNESMRDQELLTDDVCESPLSKSQQYIFSALNDGNTYHHPEQKSIFINEEKCIYSFSEIADFIEENVEEC